MAIESIFLSTLQTDHTDVSITISTMAEENHSLEEFGDWESDDEELSVKSLFDESRHGSIQAQMDHDAAKWGFSLFDAARAVGMGDLSTIMLVNLIRRRVVELGAGGVGVDAAFVAKLNLEIAERTFLGNEEFMVPVLENDQLLYLLQDALGMAGDYSDEDEVGIVGGAGGVRGEGSAGSAVGTTSDTIATAAAIDTLKLEVNKYKSIITALATEAGTEGSPESQSLTVPNDGYYFESYSQLSIHETMLRDAPRTGAYAAALATPGFLKDKVVLDVGCGTGILSMLAARAGAKKVIGVDLSSMIEQSRKIVDRNGLGDVVTLLQGRMEEVSLPSAADEVDVIVSEWMGYGLYFENMVSSVLHARKEYLAPGGVMMPSHAMLYLEAMATHGSDDRVSWWSDVYGFDMSPCSWMLTREAQVQFVAAKDICSHRECIHTLDMLTAEEDDLDFQVQFGLQITTSGPVRGVVISFDVDFRMPGGAPSVTLSTGAQAADTHWKQTALWLRPELVEQWKAGDVMRGTLHYQRHATNLRDYDIVLSWEGVGSGLHTQSYSLC